MIYPNNGSILPLSTQSILGENNMSLEIIARNRWHEPLATWPIHDENH
jgi:hypothetical protein